MLLVLCGTLWLLTVELFSCFVLFRVLLLSLVGSVSSGIAVALLGRREQLLALLLIGLWHGVCSVHHGLFSFTLNVIGSLRSVIVALFLLQSTLVLSTSLISNNRLSRSENLVPVLTW